MDLSKYLSKVIGLYQILIGLAMLLNMQQFRIDILKLMHNGPLMLYAGCLTVIIGLLIVVGHNIWQWRWNVLVTIAGWIILIKGFTLVMFPHTLDDFTIYLFTHSNVTYSVAIGDILLGVLFCYLGFSKKK